MFGFGKNNGNDTGKKLMDPDTYDRLLKRISERDTDLSALKSKVDNLQNDVAHLRGKMSQKLRDLQKEYSQDQEDSADEGLKYFGQ